ncbi:MAG: hypothetical protein ACLSAF_13900 [Intestinimonas sp.]
MQKVVVDSRAIKERNEEYDDEGPTGSQRRWCPCLSVPAGSWIDRHAGTNLDDLSDVSGISGGGGWKRPQGSHDNARMKENAEEKEDQEAMSGAMEPQVRRCISRSRRAARRHEDDESFRKQEDLGGAGVTVGMNPFNLSNT